MLCVLAVSGLLTGVVRDSSGALLANAAVVLAATGSAESRSTVTDAAGSFRYADLPPRRYTLTAAYPGLETSVRTIEVGSAPVAVTIVLSPSALSETVTVTATRTGNADVQTAVGAVTVLTSRTLGEISARSIEDLADVVPTLSTSQNAGLAMIALRGISTNNGFPGTDPSVTVSLDGVYLARSTMAYASFLDVDRVEVLRGPQGTLYGRNAVGGAINVITRDPGTSLETRARLTGGNYHTGRVEATFGGPLVRDRLMGSVAVLRAVRHGFVEDLGHPDHSLGGEDAWSARAKLRVVVNPRLQVMFIGDDVRDDGVPLTYAKPLTALPGATFDRPPGFWTVRTSDAASSHNGQRGASAKLTAVLGQDTTVTSLTAYRASNFRFVIDGDLTELPLLTIAPVDRQRQLSQEITLASRGPRGRWVAGAYAFDEREHGTLEVTQRTQGVQNRPSPHATTRSLAAFGERTYDLSQRVSIVGGLRFTHERKGFDSTGGLYRLGTSVLAVPASFYSFTDRVSYDVWTPKAAVHLRLAPAAFAYGSATRGFKSGGFNLTTPEPGRAYRPEHTWSYEAGVKQTFARGAARLNADVFYNDYRDLQVLSFIRFGVVDISNAASAVTRGVEVDGSAVARGWTFNGSVAWLDARYREYLAATPAGAEDVSGHRLNFAPAWSGNGGAIYRWPAGARGTAFVRGDATWRSRTYFTAFNTATETQGRFGVAHVRAGFTPRGGHWDVALYMRNLTNQPFIVGTANVSPVAIGGRQGEPRHWGVEFTVQR